MNYLYHGYSTDNLKILRTAKPLDAKSVNNKEDIKAVYMTDNWYVALIAGLFSSLRKYLEEHAYKNGSITWYDYNGKLVLNMSKNLYNILSKNKDTNIFIYRILKDKKFKVYKSYYISNKPVKTLSKEIITYKSALQILEKEEKRIKILII